MSIDHKKLMRVSKIIFKLMASAASVSIVSFPSMTITGGVYASEENQAKKMMEQLNATLMNAAEKNPILNFHPIEMVVADAISSKGKQNLGHLQEDLFKVLQSLDKKGDGWVRSNHELTNKFAQFQKLAYGFEDTFVSTLAKEVRMTADSLIEAIDSNNLTEAKAPYVYLMLAWTDYAIKTQQLREIYDFESQKINRIVSERAAEITKETKLAKVQAENSAASIERDFEKKKRELEDKIVNVKASIAKEQNPSLRRTLESDLQLLEAQLDQNTSQKKVEIKKNGDKLLLTEQQKEADIKAFKEEKDKELTILKNKLMYIFQPKGSTMTGSKTLERWAKGLPQNRSDYIGFAELDQILLSNPELIHAGREKFFQALFDGYATDARSAKYKRVLQLFLGVKGEIQEPEEKKTVSTKSSSKSKRSEVKKDSRSETKATKTRRSEIKKDSQEEDENQEQESAPVAPVETKRTLTKKPASARGKSTRSSKQDHALQKETLPVTASESTATSSTSGEVNAGKKVTKEEVGESIDTTTATTTSTATTTETTSTATTTATTTATATTTEAKEVKNSPRTQEEQFAEDLAAGYQKKKDRALESEVREGLRDTSLIQDYEDEEAINESKTDASVKKQDRTYVSVAIAAALAETQQELSVTEKKSGSSSSQNIKKENFPALPTTTESQGKKNQHSGAQSAKGWSGGRGVKRGK